MFTTILTILRTITSKQGLHVIRSMFGLKQALGSWNSRFDVIIMVYDLIQNEMILVYIRRLVGVH